MQSAEVPLTWRRFKSDKITKSRKKERKQNWDSLDWIFNFRFLNFQVGQYIKGKRESTTAYLGKPNLANDQQKFAKIDPSLKNQMPMEM